MICSPIAVPPRLPGSTPGRLFFGCDGPDPFGSTGRMPGHPLFFRKLPGDSRIGVAWLSLADAVTAERGSLFQPLVKFCQRLKGPPALG